MFESAVNLFDRHQLLAISIISGCAHDAISAAPYHIYERVALVHVKMHPQHVVPTGTTKAKVKRAKATWSYAKQY
jgi:hypothetical protein